MSGDDETLVWRITGRLESKSTLSWVMARIDTAEDGMINVRVDPCTTSVRGLRDLAELLITMADKTQAALPSDHADR